MRNINNKTILITGGSGLLVIILLNFYCKKKIKNLK